MKILVSILYIHFLLIKSFGQKTDFPKIYYLDSEKEYCKKFNKKGYFLEVNKIADSQYRFSYYKSSTYKIITIETFKDEDNTMPNGLFAYYNTNGSIDSFGNVKNGKRLGDWFFFDSKNYKFDSITKHVFYDQNYKPTIIIAINKKDSNFVEGKFKGKFKNYLERNLKYPQEAMEMQSQGIVWLLFTVTENGEIVNAFPSWSQNYFLDKEALRIIYKSSGQWNITTLNENPVSFLHSQLIAFKLN